ncbi:MAG: phosphoribosylformylglycinamidine synthase subunit PurQ [candidate division Zixibacteria bacterium]|nr:phosphoribosylformylglycinamidine synthase subunit PurQ [candidate division Zixibacteria bacterium]
MKFGVIIFPGSNCDYDAYMVIKDVIKRDVEFLWHQDTSLSNCDCVILPGGFSYGDYLRTGAIARFSSIMKKLMDFAENGGLVVGICNGFQILLEAGLLPGAMLRNTPLRFICKFVHIEVENENTPFTNFCHKGQVLKIPIAHTDGNYFISGDGLKKLKQNQQIVFRYCDQYGKITPEANPNGSLYDIAGICNEKRNVLGMMPHPERASENILGAEDGKHIFQSIVSFFEKGKSI